MRALHADQMLDRAGDAERDIELRRNGLPRAAHLPLHRQPSGVADRPRRGNFGAQRRGKLLSDPEIRLVLDAAADRDDPFGLRQIHGLLRLLKRRFRFFSNRGRVDGHVDRADRRR